MKIAYIISINNHGRGGHLHSLTHISKTLSDIHNVRIYSIGAGDYSIIKMHPNFEKHIYFNGFNIISLYKEVKQIIEEYSPDIFHFFDDQSYNVIRLIVSSKWNKLVLNKCGGPNPIRLKYPFIKNLILFSYENYIWFTNNKKYNQSLISLIPNRVERIFPTENLKIIKNDNNEFSFVRICRISKTYLKSIEDSLHLVDYLINKRSFEIKLFIIGVIEDKNIFEKLKENHLYKNGRIVFLTKSEYTTRASKMLCLANAVIGTGRGLMEAASLSLPLLTINSNDIYPVLLTKTSFQDAFKTNFSERNLIMNYNSQENLDLIAKMIIDKDYYNELSDFSKKTFEKFFNVEKVKDEYTMVYENSQTSNRKIIPDTLLILKSFYQYSRGKNLKK